MDRSENSTSEVEEESQSLNEEKEIETGLLHFRDEMIDFWEKETSTARKKIQPKQKKLNDMAEEFDFSHLSPEEFHVLREAGTERAWSGEYNKHYSKGNYNCRGCGNQLFESDTKFDSGSGWPSFDQAIDGSVIELEDRSYGMLRVEVQCSRCKSHLGHVFPDGPRETTGQRYCMNSLSLTFEGKPENPSEKV